MSGISKKLRRVAAASAVALSGMFSSAAAQEGPVKTLSPYEITFAANPFPSPVTVFDNAVKIIKSFHYSSVRVEATKDLIDQLRDEVLLQEKSPETALNEILSQLDPHSVYIKGNKALSLNEELYGIGALGFSVNVINSRLRVTDIYQGGTAKRAGLLENDIITHINGVRLDASTMTNVNPLLCRPDRNVVDLTILRSENGNAITKSLKCKYDQKRSVFWRILPGKIGYIQIREFSEKMYADFLSAVRELQLVTKNSLDGYVIGLRGNTGGYLDEATRLADSVLNSEHVMYYTVDRTGKKTEVRATYGDILGGKKLVVLVDDSSCSASELVAGILQTKKRATIMGWGTCGKGSTQLPYLIGAQGRVWDQHLTIGVLKLTTDLYFMSDGNSPQLKGLIPDVEVVDPRVPMVNTRKEFQRANPLDNAGTWGASLSPAEMMRHQKCEVTPEFMTGYTQIKYSVGVPDGALICAVKYLQDVPGAIVSRSTKHQATALPRP